MPSTSEPRPRELSDEETAARAALYWAEGPGRVFFSNALVNGTPEQVRITLARIQTIRTCAEQCPTATRGALN